MSKQVDNVNQNPESRSDELFEALNSVVHHFRALTFKRLRDSSFALTHMEGKALGFFVRNPAATQSDLVGHSGRDKAQIARLIGSLKDKGLLDARANDEDRRSVRLHLTVAGRALWERMHQQTRELQGKAIETLSPDECEQLLALLRRIDRNLEA